jgi:YggT family protein
MGVRVVELPSPCRGGAGGGVFHRAAFGGTANGPDEVWPGEAWGEVWYNYRMFVLKNLILALATVLDWAIMIYIWIVIIRALISWVEPNPYNPIVRFLHAVTEPLLAPIRYYLLRGMPVGIDLSPMVLILLLVLIQRFSIPTLMELAMRLQ